MTLTSCPNKKNETLVIWTCRKSEIYGSQLRIIHATLFIYIFCFAHWVFGDGCVYPESKYRKIWLDISWRLNIDTHRQTVRLPALPLFPKCTRLTGWAQLLFRLRGLIPCLCFVWLSEYSDCLRLIYSISTVQNCESETQQIPNAKKIVIDSKAACVIQIDK